jgi:hypothetical protein
VVPSFVYSVGYSAHKQACNQYKHTQFYRLSSRKNNWITWRNKCYAGGLYDGLVGVYPRRV